MKIPLEWLSEFVDLNNILPETLAEELSLKAFEVEDLEYIGASLKGPLVAGKILEISKHPNADKLQITKTQIAENQEPKQIVCGARNIEVGQIVPVALPNAQVLNRSTGEVLQIKESKIRDVFSQGMLCSASELGLESDTDGILVLPENTLLGTDLIEELKLKPQIVLNVASRSNRGDGLCLQGIARETALCVNRNLKIDYYKQNFEQQFTELTQDLPEIKINNLEFCHQIGFIQIENITIAQSPDWLKEKLKLAGISSINNIVDITNYIMLEIGQPMHAYDLNTLNLQNGLSVQLACQGQTLETLDKQICKLGSKNLLISDCDKPLSLAGVMGGLAGSIQNDTKNILFEAACFVPSSIRASSRSAGISTESSRRFERGTDYNLIKIALLKAVQMVKQLAGGEVKAFGLALNSSLNEQFAINKTINLNLKDFEKLISLSISPSQAQNLLEQLGFAVQIIDNNQISVSVPSFRLNDIKRPIDLIEELARFMGLNQIPFNALPGVSNLLKTDKNLFNLKTSLRAQGYSETISSSLVKPSENQEENTISMKNPLSKDYAQLRTSLIDGLLSAASINTKRQQNQIRLFEVGKAYFAINPQAESNIKQTNTQEILNLGLILSCKGKTANWQNNIQNSADFYELKGILENITNHKLNFLPNSPAQAFGRFDYLLHPNIKAYIQLNGKFIGFLGKIHPLQADKFNISENTFIAQLVLESLLKPRKFKLKELNDNPVLQRDFTIDILENAQISHSEIEKLVKENKLNHLQDISLLSLYKATDGKTSLSYRLCFQADENLNSEIINKQIENLKNSLQKQFPLVSFRE